MRTLTHRKIFETNILLASVDLWLVGRSQAAYRSLLRESCKPLRFSQGYLTSLAVLSKEQEVM